MIGHRFFVPGRIEVLGKHTDYAGGRSLLAAVDRGFTITAGPVDDDAILILAADADARVTYRPEGGGAWRRDPGGGADPSDPSAPSTGDAGAPGWARYSDALVRRVAGPFGHRLRGARITFTGDLPPASGLSSSSALLTGLFLGLDAVCGFRRDPLFRERLPDRERLAAYLAAIERGSPLPGLDGPADARGDGGEAGGAKAGGGVGTRGGSEDHTAILCAEEGRVVRYAFEPVRRRGSARLPAGWTFAVACSGVVAEKARGARAPYNRLSDLARAAAAAWRAETGGSEPHLGAALEAAGDADALARVVTAGVRRLEQTAVHRLEPAALSARVRQFAAEVALVDAAFDAIAGADGPALGEIAARSQALAEEQLGNQVPQTTWLARAARSAGAMAASAFGAGFGGAVWALVERDAAAALLEDWAARYADAFPDDAPRATFFASDAAAAAGPLPPHRP